MGPEALAQVLRPLSEMFRAAEHPNLLRGLEAPDDAAVWKVDETRAIVLTADFFPPVVDDPYDFGAIAAANSLSDLYAMGARPLFGINLVGFPEGLDPSILTEILRGGGEKMREAGAVVAGGHTTTDNEPKYGLAVVGEVHPDRILANEGARPGDVLYLTKPLGTGIVTTAHKKGKATPEDLRAAVDSMKRLNGRSAALIAEEAGTAHALTDITGFSLLGHGHEMAHLSGVSLAFDWESLPLLPGVEQYARKGWVTGGGRRNLSFLEPFVTWERNLEAWQREVLLDPQTSGGLLAAVAPEGATALEARFREAEEPLWRVGAVLEGRGGTVRVR